MPSSVELWSVALGVIITAAVGLFFGWMPARRAAMLDPIEALAPGIAMSKFTKQFALLGETAAMAFDTLRSNKMRSALTVLGVVIGVTSIVGMTSLIRGFDSSLRDSINSLGPNTIFVQKFGAVSFSSGALVHGADAAAESHRRRHEGDRADVDDDRHGRHLARRRRPRQPTRSSGCSTAASAPRPLPIMGTTERYVDDQLREDVCRPLVHASRKCSARATWRVIGYGVYEALFEKRGIDPIGKPVRVGAVEYTVIGVIGKRPSPAASPARRLRDRAVHRVPQAVRQREAAARSVRHRR